ncbi:MAG: hypothetical protein PHF51_00780 [Candidatus ainarchaeum sp.]|nr:hypothetical protein [Candidatus ainarchaeum sp.]
MKHRDKVSAGTAERPLRELLRSGMLAGDGPGPGVALRVGTPVERLQVWRLERAAKAGKWDSFQEIGAESMSAYVGEKALGIAAGKKQLKALGYIASRSKLAEVQKFGLVLAAENGSWPAFNRIAVNSEIPEVGVFGARLAGEKGKAKTIGVIAFKAKSREAKHAALEEAVKARLWATVGNSDDAQEMMKGATREDVDALVSKRDAKGLTALVFSGPEEVARYGLAAAAKAGMWEVVTETVLYGWRNQPKELCFDLARDAGKREVFWSAMRHASLKAQADAVDYALKNKRWGVFADGAGFEAPRLYRGLAEKAVLKALDEGEDWVAVTFASRHSPELEKRVMEWGAENHRFDLVGRMQHSTKHDEVVRYGNAVIGRAEKEDVLAAAAKSDWDMVAEFGMMCRPDVANLAVDELAGEGGQAGWDGVNKVACHTKHPEVARHVKDVAVANGNVETLFWLFAHNPDVSRGAFRDVIDGKAFSRFRV